MQLDEILTPERAFCRVSATSKKKAIEVISHSITQVQPEYDQSELYAALIAREKVSPTSLGFGIALPHCRLSSCRALVGAIATLENPVDFGAFDDLPVTTLFFLIAPENENEDHLKAMAMLVAKFEHESYRNQLVTAKTNQALFDAAMLDPVADQPQVHTG